MARIRTIKPEFWKHEDLSALPEATHMLAAALINHADDEGYFNANPALVRSECCPLREPSVSVHDSLSELVRIGYLRIYRGKDGKTYGRILTFADHQRVNRPTPSKIKAIGELTEGSVSPHAQLSEGSPPERKGKEGKGKGREQEQTPPISPSGGLPVDELKPKRAKRANAGITYADFVVACKADGEHLIPEDHAVFGFATDAQIPRDFLELAWREFARQYRPTSKTQAGKSGWRQKFENCVRRNWFKLWWFPSNGQCELTTAGQQLKRERDAA